MGIALLTAPLTLTGYPRTLAEMSVYAVDMIERKKDILLPRLRQTTTTENRRRIANDLQAVTKLVVIFNPGLLSRYIASKQVVVM